GSKSRWPRPWSRSTSAWHVPCCASRRRASAGPRRTRGAPVPEAAAHQPTLVDLLPDAVLQLDAAGRIIDANAMAVAVTGHPLETLRGASVAELLQPQSPDTGPLLVGGLHPSSRLRSVTGIPEQQVRLLRADGVATEVYVTGSYQRDNGG